VRTEEHGSVLKGMGFRECSRNSFFEVTPTCAPPAGLIDRKCALKASATIAWGKALGTCPAEKLCGLKAALSHLPYRR
jgi:hypothetical protein